MYPVWASGTDDIGATWAYMDENGDFSICNVSNTRLWTTQTSLNSHSSLYLGDDGSLVVRDYDGNVIWSR